MRTLGRLIVTAAAIGLAAACAPKGGSAAADGAEMALGDSKAKVTVVEYASVTCTHCARFNAEVFPAFKAKYVDTGQVRYVFREFLTPPASVSAAGFLLARCAGRDKYFGVVDTLFRSQNDMFTGDPRAMLFRIGRSAGMTDDQVTACIQDEKGLADLTARVQKATDQDKVAVTPTFVIGGKMVQGEQSMAALDAMIQPLLAR